MTSYALIMSPTQRWCSILITPTHICTCSRIHKAAQSSQLVGNNGGDIDGHDSFENKGR